MEQFVFARVEALPNSVDVLRDAATALVQPCRDEEGNLAYSVFQAVENARQIWFHARWRDEASLERHGTTDHVMSWLKVVEEHAVGPVEVHVVVQRA